MVVTLMSVYPYHSIIVSLNEKDWASRESLYRRHRMHQHILTLRVTLRSIVLAFQENPNELFAFLRKFQSAQGSRIPYNSQLITDF